MEKLDSDRFYLEYISDYVDFKMIYKMDKTEAMSKINKSDNADRLTTMMRGMTQHNSGRITDIMNKGAVLLSEETRLWVYKHDDAYYLYRQLGFGEKENDDEPVES